MLKCPSCGKEKVKIIGSGVAARGEYGNLPEAKMYKCECCGYRPTREELKNQL